MCANATVNPSATMFCTITAAAMPAARPTSLDPSSLTRGGIAAVMRCATAPRPLRGVPAVSSVPSSRRFIGRAEGHCTPEHHRYPHFSVQEHALAERLITYDTSNVEGIQSAAGFVKGWLESRDVDVTVGSHNGVPVIAATVGAAPGAGPTVIFHGHIDVVPGRPERRGRPAVRPRRLRHEGRTRGDDGRHARPRRADGGARALRVRVGRGVR